MKKREPFVMFDCVGAILMYHRTELCVDIIDKISSSVVLESLCARYYPIVMVQNRPLLFLRFKMFMLVEVHLSNLVFMTILVAVAQLSAMVFAASGINAASDNNLLEVMRDIPYFSLTVILIETAQIEAHFQDALTKRTALVPINNAFLDTRTDIMIHFLTD